MIRSRDKNLPENCMARTKVAFERPFFPLLRPGYPPLSVNLSAMIEREARSHPPDSHRPVEEVVFELTGDLVQDRVFDELP